MTNRGATLSEYLLSLANNPQALAQFQRDPRAAAQQAGLPAEAVEVIASKDPARIQRAVLDDNGSGTTSRARDEVTVVVIVL